jgi:SAM-dependent methyltransferase
MDGIPNDQLGALYDAFFPWGGDPDDAFHLDQVMSAESVLDVGCGTGMLLHQARGAGHAGRLCGLDPDPAMLARARAMDPARDIEWVMGDAASASSFWRGEFDLVVMSSHAFQAFIEDECVRASLAAIREVLKENGRFVFEAFNPGARTWERWGPERAREFTDPTGARVLAYEDVRSPVLPGPHGVVVDFAVVFTSPDWPAPVEVPTTMRFHEPAALASFLTEAGLVIDHQYGDWDRTPLTAAGPEIITIARRPCGHTAQPR